MWIDSDIEAVQPRAQLSTASRRTPRSTLQAFLCRCCRQHWFGRRGLRGRTPLIPQRERPLEGPLTDDEEDRGKRVVWVSVDPCTGTAIPYPRDAAMRLERARSRGEASVPLVNCGLPIMGAVVQLSEPPVQWTTRGQRDVRRLEVPAGTTVLRVHTVWDQRWKAADGPVAGSTVERVRTFSAADAVDALDVGGKSSNFAAACLASPCNELQEMQQEARADELPSRVQDPTDLVGLWEWCMVGGMPDQAVNVAGLWGVYDEAQNDAIEAAFLREDNCVDVAIGVRSYQIVFDRPAGGRQIDAVHKKLRRVRRRLVSPEERRLALRAAAQAAGAARPAAQEECAICFARFEDTQVVPVVCLPACGHSFHGACVQQVADMQGACPLCRAEVDWSAAFTL